MSEPVLAGLKTMDVHEDWLHADREGTAIASSLEDKRKPVRAPAPVDCSKTWYKVSQ